MPPRLLIALPTCWTEAETVIENKEMTIIAKTESFKYFAGDILLMKPKSKDKDERFWAKVREWQKDPEFRKAVKEFVKRTTS